METPADIIREVAPLRVGVELGSDPATAYYHRERINILVFDSATLADIRAAQNFLHTLAAVREAEENEQIAKRMREAPRA